MTGSRGTRFPGAWSPGAAAPAICLIQPPLVQLNSPYPAPYYLKSFLESRGCPVEVRDHSIGLFEQIFCRKGLERIFADAAAKTGSRRGGAAPGKAARYYTERFLSERDLWLASIDRLTGFIRGRDREWGHLLTLANGTVPGGPRFDACLDALDSQPSPEAAPRLASALLADLADFITGTLDPAFTLIRYLPRLGGGPGFRDFRELDRGAEGYVMETFYRPLLAEEWTRLNGGKEPFILGITIPFPGCLTGALTCARSARECFGPRVKIIAGGGYVNTELRFLETPELFDRIDYLSFDRGYGSWAAILEREAPGTKSIGALTEPPLYRTMYRSPETGTIVRDPEIAGESPPPEGAFAKFREIDREAVKTVFPDYGGVNFPRYLCPVDDANLMHRLWSDGRWLKAYLAHGCYWQRCTFCDTGLDYIRSFEPVDPEALFRHLTAQAEKTGVRGVHLVDEAAPPASLRRLAELNREATLREETLPLVFWGNIRFDRSFDPDTAALLAAGGLIGVSAGIEVASEQGLKRLDKGIGLEEVVRVCAAFKEAGILTHGYLIYGYWDSSDQEIIDSAETIRQLFAAGLLDSAFWHQFVLTRHSRLYHEQQQGLRRGPAVQEDPDPSRFALNDLPFKGEERFTRFTEGLDRLLAAWMSGDTSCPVEAPFPFKVPRPAVPPGTIDTLLDAYARYRNKNRAAIPESGRLLFLGSRPLANSSPGEPSIFWRWRLSDHRLKAGTPAAARKTAALLEQASRSPGLPAPLFYQELADLLGPAIKQSWKTLRHGGVIICN